MPILRPILSFLLVVFCTVLCRSQDIVFSQYYASPLQLNPAFAGNGRSPLLALNYRLQYPNLMGTNTAFSTFGASYDQFFDGLNSGIGFSLLTDNIGDGLLKRTNAAFNYAYHLKTSRENSVRFGLQVGMQQLKLDFNKLVFFDQLDPNGNPPTQPSSETRPQNLNKTNLDITAGFLYVTQRFYGGFSAHHLTMPNEGFYSENKNLQVEVPIRLSLHGGYQIVFQEQNRYQDEIYLSPNVLITRQGSFFQANVGAYFGSGPLFAGTWYRHTKNNPDALIFSAGVRQDYFKVGYSYDYAISGLANRTSGTHEISLLFTLDPDANNRKDINDCMQMFR